MCIRDSEVAAFAFAKLLFPEAAHAAIIMVAGNHVHRHTNLASSAPRPRDCGLVRTRRIEEITGDEDELYAFGSGYVCDTSNGIDACLLDEGAFVGFGNR